jgi:hypothetical protein
MLQKQFVAGGGKVADAPALTIKELIEWLSAEFKVFKTYLKMIFDDMIVFCGGNAFGQCLHDAATLANKICLGMIPLKSGHDDVGAESIENVIQELLGDEYK